MIFLIKFFKDQVICANTHIHFIFILCVYQKRNVADKDAFRKYITAWSVITGLKQWKWNTSSHLKPEDPADDYRVLAIARTVYLQQEMELIHSVTGIAQTQFVEFISKARRTGGCGLGSDGSADLNPKSLCSKTTPDGSVSKGLNRRPCSKEHVFSRSDTDGPSSQNKANWKNIKLFYSFGLMWIQWWSSYVRNYEILKIVFIQFAFTPTELLK